VGLSHKALPSSPALSNSVMIGFMSALPDRGARPSCLKDTTELRKPEATGTSWFCAGRFPRKVLPDIAPGGEDQR
jgi:hypothetical protein